MKPSMNPQSGGSLWVLDHLLKQLVGEEAKIACSEIHDFGARYPDSKVHAEELLDSYKEGVDLWEWGIDRFEAPGTLAGFGYSYGWCTIKDGQVLASLCHSYS
jgi:hypothetical protein